jgi:LysR family transcriptional regulator, regulator for bpeEF and oprC
VAVAITNGKLQPILTNYAPKLATPIAVVYPKKPYLSAKVRAFIEFMEELISELKYDGIVD